VLAEDAQARAIDVPDWARPSIIPPFVELSIHHDKVNSWL
jgi:tRNA 2-thiouridine synthesizing protein B